MSNSKNRFSWRTFRAWVSTELNRVAEWQCCEKGFLGRRPNLLWYTVYTVYTKYTVTVGEPILLPRSPIFPALADGTDSHGRSADRRGTLTFDLLTAESEDDVRDPPFSLKEEPEETSTPAV